MEYVWNLNHLAFRRLQLAEVDRRITYENSLLENGSISKEAMIK